MPLLKSTLSGALHLTGKALSLTSSVVSTGVRLLRSAPRAIPPLQTRDEPRVEPARTAAPVPSATQVAPDDLAARRGRIVEPAATPLLDEQPHVRTSETHIAELADQSAADVIAAVDRLSTDELRLLIEHETSHRNRRTVLQAIEKALAPPVATP